MSGRENKKMQNQMNLINYELISADMRIKMIYNRFRNGKSITLDDIKYLWLKDLEGFEKLGRNILEIKIEKERENELDNKQDFEQDMKLISMDSAGYEKINIENTEEYEDNLDSLEDSDISIFSVKNVIEAITSLKSLIGKMSENELLDMLKNLNEAQEMKKLAREMKLWDDRLVEKMVIYTYEQEKEFDMRA
jgi:hypothetical protein